MEHPQPDSVVLGRRCLNPSMSGMFYGRCHTRRETIAINAHNIGRSCWVEDVGRHRLTLINHYEWGASDLTRISGFCLSENTFNGFLKVTLDYVERMVELSNNLSRIVSGALQMNENCCFGI